MLLRRTQLPSLAHHSDGSMGTTAAVVAVAHALAVRKACMLYVELADPRLACIRAERTASNITYRQQTGSASPSMFVFVEGTTARHRRTRGLDVFL